MRGIRGTAGQRADALRMREPGQERLGRADASRSSRLRERCSGLAAACAAEERYASGASRSLPRCWLSKDPRCVRPQPQGKVWPPRATSRPAGAVDGRLAAPGLAQDRDPPGIQQGSRARRKRSPQTPGGCPRSGPSGPRWRSSHGRAALTTPAPRRLRRIPTCRHRGRRRGTAACPSGTRACRLRQRRSVPRCAAPSCA